MRCSILIFLAIAVSNLQAAINFAPTTRLGAAEFSNLSSELIFTPDLDRDGAPDLLVVQGNRARVHLNRGLQGFIEGPAFDLDSEAGQAPDANASLPVVLSDFDGDGRLDLGSVWAAQPFTTGVRQRGIAVRLGVGDGSFGPEVRYPLVASQARPAWRIGDVDGDGDEDIVIAHLGQLHVARNDAGAFPTVSVAAVPGAVSVTGHGLLDGDARLDLIGTLPSGGAQALLLSQGDGTFALASAPASLSNGVQRTWALDINADGRRDLITFGHESVQFGGGVAHFLEYRALLRQADDSLVVTDELNTISPESWFRRAYFGAGESLADLDGDGRLELVMPVETGGCFGPFGCPAIITPPNGFAHLVIGADGSLSEGPAFVGGHFGFADVDGDGRADAIGMSGGVSWRRSSTSSNSPPSAPAELRMQVPLDQSIDDGWLNLSVADADANALRYRIIEGPRRASATVSAAGGWLIYRRGANATGGQDHIVLEIDDGAGGVRTVQVTVEVEGLGGGGAPDLLGLAVLGLLLLSHASQGRRMAAKFRPLMAVVGLGLSSAAPAAVNLTPAQQMASEPFYFGGNWILVGDLDGDPHFDVLWAGGFSVGAHRAFGRPEMSVQRSTLSPGGHNFLTLGNLDATPGQDLITGEWTAANGGTATVAVYHNDGSGRFLAGQRLVFAEGFGNPGLQVIDLDADGDDDALVYGATDGSTRILTNDGTGNLSLGATIPMVAGHSRPRAVDVDLDGLMDLWFPRPATLAAGPGLVAPGLPGGGFGPAAATDAPGTASHQLVDIDLDGDGDLDRVGVNREHGALAERLLTWRREAGVLEAWGEATLPPPDYNFPVGSWGMPSARQFGDLDGDGRLEYVRRVSTPAIDWVSEGSHSLEVARLDDTGRFITLTARFAMHWSEIDSDPLVADFDGDGRADLLGKGISSPHANDFQLLLRRATAAPNSPPVLDDTRVSIDLRPSGICCGSPGARLAVQDADENQLTFTIVRQGLQGRASFIDPHSAFLRYYPDDPRLAVEDTVDLRIDDGAGGVVTVRLKVLAVGNRNDYSGGGAPDLLGLAVLGLLLLRRNQRPA